MKYTTDTIYFTLKDKNNCQLLINLPYLSQGLLKTNDCFNLIIKIIELFRIFLTINHKVLRRKICRITFFFSYPYSTFKIAVLLDICRKQNAVTEMLFFKRFQLT